MIIEEDKAKFKRTKSVTGQRFTRKIDSFRDKYSDEAFSNPETQFALSNAVTERNSMYSLEGSQMVAGATSSIQDFDGTALNVYNQSSFRLVGDIDEFYRMPSYLANYMNNPFVSHHVNYQFATAFGDGWRVEGPGAEEIMAAMEADKTYDKLNSMWFTSFLYGIAYLEVFVKRKTGKFSRTRPLNSQNIVITVNTTPGSQKYGEREYREFAPVLASDSNSVITSTGNIAPLNKLKEDRLIIIKNRDIPFKAYPPSPIRHVLPIYMYLNDIVGDIAVAIKHVAYSPLIAKIDTSAFDIAESDQILKNFAEQLTDMQSAGENIVCDKDTDIGLIGNLGGGGGNAQMMNVSELMKPLLATALANGAIPLGLIMSDFAESATVIAQVESYRPFYERLRGDFKAQIETQLFPKITDKPAWVVFNEPPVTSSAGLLQISAMMELYKVGIISKEYMLHKFNIVDEGTTFIQDTMPKIATPENKEGEKEGKNDK